MKKSRGSRNSHGRILRKFREVVFSRCPSEGRGHLLIGSCALEELGRCFFVLGKYQIHETREVGQRRHYFLCAHFRFTER